jgi:hypothetical protein
MGWRREKKETRTARLNRSQQRHSVSQWSKQALTIQEAKEILRHANIQTTGDIYAGLPLEAKEQHSSA